MVEAGGRYGITLVLQKSDTNCKMNSTSNESVLSSIVPFFAVSLVGSSADWNFTSVPQAGLLNRTLPIARGHLLGGSSSISE